MKIKLKILLNKINFKIKNKKKYMSINKEIWDIIKFGFELRKMKNFNIPPVWTLLAIVSSGLLHFVYPLTLFQFRAIDTGVIAIGVYLILATPIWFKRKSTTIIPRRKPTTLIVDGPFKMSRNPMYLGMVMLSFGVGLSLGSIQAVIPSILLFFF